MEKQVKTKGKVKKSPSYPLHLNPVVHLDSVKKAGFKTKAEFIAYGKKKGYTMRYSGKTQTFLLRKEADHEII